MRTRHDTMRMLTLPGWLSAAVLLLTPGAGHAQAGTIQGTISVKGTVPPATLIQVTKNQDVCGETIEARNLVVKDGKLAFAIVSVDGLKGEIPATEYLLSNSGCRFEPPVLAATAGGTLVVDNHDEILHNTHLNFMRGSTSRTVGNWALSSKGVTIKADRVLRRAGRIDASCDAHSWMHATIRVFDHPYFAVSDEAGAFEIPDVPAGTHLLKVWHEVLGEVEKQVTVNPGATTSVEFVFPAAGI